MDIEEAIKLIENGRLSDLDIEILWQIEDVLSASADPRAKQYLDIFQKHKAGIDLAQHSLLMQEIINNNSIAVAEVEAHYGLNRVFNLQPRYDRDNFKLQDSATQKLLLPLINFYRRVRVNNTGFAESVNANDLFQQNSEIARLRAVKDIYLNPKFSQLTEESKQLSYAKAFVMAMEENIFVLVSNQIIENISYAKHSQLSLQEQNKIIHEVEQKFQALINPKNNAEFKLSNVNIIGTQIAELNRLSNAAGQIYHHTGSDKLLKLVKSLDDSVYHNYPDAHMILRPLAQAPNMGFIAGKVGVSSYAASNLAQTVHQCNPAVQDSSASMMLLLSKKPSLFRSFKNHIVGSIMRIFSSILNLLDFGLISKKVASAWKKLVKHVYFPTSKNSKLSMTKYNNLTQTLVNSELSVMSREVAHSLKDGHNQENSYYVWKDFNERYKNSSLGMALYGKKSVTPSSTSLTSPNFEEYTKEVIIPLKKDKELPNGAKILRNIFSGRKNNKEQ